MRLVMMGTGSFAEPTFNAILGSRHEVVGLVTQPDRPTGKERASTRQASRSLKDIALARKLPVLQPEFINTPEGVRDLAAFGPDLLVVAAYGQILSNEILAVSKQGGINVHASLLPKYRGAAPINWAIYNGETETGVTIIRMSVHLDAGDILDQQALAIGPDETAGELEARLAPLGADLALKMIDQIEAGAATGTKQDKSRATKAPKLTKEHGLIDWTRSAKEVCDQIRAMQPWPTAYTFLNRPAQPALRLIVHRARPSSQVAEISQPTRPGAASAEGGRLFVRTGKSECVEILELQASGKKNMNADQFLLGNPIPLESMMSGG